MILIAKHIQDLFAISQSIKYGRHRSNFLTLFNAEGQKYHERLITFRLCSFQMYQLNIKILLLFTFSEHIYVKNVST